LEKKAYEVASSSFPHQHLVEEGENWEGGTYDRVPAGSERGTGDAIGGEDDPVNSGREDVVRPALEEVSNCALLPSASVREDWRGGGRRTVHDDGVGDGFRRDESAGFLVLDFEATDHVLKQEGDGSVTVHTTPSLALSFSLEKERKKKTYSLW
jgi:hypothetical protein